MSEENKKTTRTISRREFLRDAGIVVGGTAVGSAFFLSACGEEVEVTKTVTTTAPGSTVTTTAPGSTVTTTAADNTVTVTKYTCPVCEQEFSSINSLKLHFDTEHPNEGKIVVSTADSVIFTVNGKKFPVSQVKPNWTLSYVLREKLGLTGTKTACGEGDCATCTVIMDDEAILSCMTLAIECQGKDIRTIEGLANGDELDPLQKAVIENESFQCGYCLPGLMMASKALLNQNANPTAEEVKTAIGGHICRCGTFKEFIHSVTMAAGG